MQNFFQPTEAEIKEAASDGNPVFKNNEPYTFLIKAVDQKDDYIQVKCGIVGGEFDGRAYSHFFRDNAVSKKLWIGLLGAFYTPEEMRAGIQPAGLLGRKAKSVAKIKGEYTNFYNFVEATDGPGSSVSADDVPF